MDAPRHHIGVQVPADPAQQEGLAEIVQEHTAFDDGDPPGLAQLFDGNHLFARRKLGCGCALHQRIQPEDDAFQHAGQHGVARRHTAQLLIHLLVQVDQAHPVER